LTVTLTSSNAIVAKAAAATVKVLPGATSATFAVATTIVAADTNVTFTASANGASATGVLTVQAARPSTVTFAPAAVRGGKSSIGTVTLSGPAPSTGISVKLVSSNASVTVPATVLVPSGKTVGTFTATTTAVTATRNVDVTATANGTSVSGTLAVRILTVANIVAKPAPVVGGIASVGTVNLTDVVTSATTVTLTSNNPNVIVPASVVIPVGKALATFPITTKVVGTSVTATITGALNGETGSGTLTVTPLNVASVTVTPAAIIGGANATGVIKLTAAPAVDTVVTLTSANPGVLSVPATVTVAKGALQATFTVTTTKPAAATTVVVTATTGGLAKTVSVSVKP
jgi:hypothetical protein